MRCIQLAAAAAALFAYVQAGPLPEGVEDAQNLEERAGRFSYFDLKTAMSGPCDLATGPDGNIWVSNFLDASFAVVNPTTGAVQQYPIPYTRSPILPVPNFTPANKVTFACVMRHGRDGKMYAATGIRDQLAVIDPKTKKVKLVDGVAPTGNLEPFNDVWPGTKGIWYTHTTAGTISFMDYKTNKITNYATALTDGPLGVFIASDNGLWVCYFFGQKIARLDLTTKKIEEFPINSPALLNPAVVRAETFTKGQHLVWFCGIVGNGMGSINTKTKKITAYPHVIPAGFPTEDAVDGNGQVWFSTLGADYLNRLNPETGNITTFKQPTIPLIQRGAVDIAMHYGPGRDMWFTELLNNRVGRFKLYGQRNPANPYF